MHRWTWMMTTAALVAACGRGPASSSAGSAAGDGGTSNEVPAPAPTGTGSCNGVVSVLLAGANPAGDQRLELVAAGVDLRGSAGALAPSFVSGETFSFPSPDPFRVAAAPIPAGGGAIEVTIRLGSVHVLAGAACTSVDLCSAPLSFRLDTGMISPERCQVLAILDLAHSVAAGPSGPVFLPHFRVRY